MSGVNVLFFLKSHYQKLCTPSNCYLPNVNHPECNGWPQLEEASFVIKAFPVPGKYDGKWSLDIFGHWNAKRSSVPYLTYWALNVGWPAFEMVFPYWWTWKETVGGANWRFRRSQKKSSPNSCKQTRSSSAIGRQESVSENSIHCAWCRECN
ncbi:hypothetical protein TNCV_1230201 [Trichonephila clavipes]|nr:hypothetical protein TNCV_1230201 [Trichonephila clavipes]